MVEILEALQGQENQSITILQVLCFQDQTIMTRKALCRLQFTKFSVAGWFKTSSNFVSSAFIVNKGGIGSDLSGRNLNYGIWMNSAGRIVAGYETLSGVDQFVTSSSDYKNGQWHYAVLTYDGSIIHLYIDGVDSASKSNGHRQISLAHIH